MIGNDVVDIALARKDSNWERPGFLPKIYTLHEQQLITTAANPELAVWNLWSKKEAAYKVLARQKNIRRFIPLQLECQTLDDYGEVRCSDTIFYTQTEATEDFIHSTAVAIAADITRVIEIPATTEILKVGSLPFIKDVLDRLKPVSVSHHGRFHRIVTLQ
ncbi:MAG TPA: 4'-phosphopantetheinyl transferase superfamily protein [Flavobacterium sp.]